MSKSIKKYPSTQDLLEISKDISGWQEKLRTAFVFRYDQIKKKTEEMPFSVVLGIKCIELKQGYADLEMPVVYETHANWNKYVCGGATSAVLDIAFGAAVETLVDYDHEMVATTHLNVDFLAPAELGKILRVTASWSEIGAKKISGELPILQVLPGHKKLVRMYATALQPPEQKEVAKGSASFVVFGRKIEK